MAQSDAAQAPPAEIYDGLWREAVARFRAGEVQTDPYLLDREHDRRTGLTVIARPGAEVQERVDAMLRHLRRIAPHQYFYDRRELHVTLLSLFTATEAFEPHLAHLSGYRSAVGAALSGASRFTVQFGGITASTGAVMVQGFPKGSGLAEIRDRLRRELRDRGLGGGLDARYQIRTAHATVMRFQVPPREIGLLVDALAAYRETDFGATTFDSLQLVKNDWYMSHDRVEVIEVYPLHGVQRFQGGARCAEG
jgi:2'-5' RNA ligase